MTEQYQMWLDEVSSSLRSINMAMEDWQKIWPFNFAKEYEAGTTPGHAAEMANRHWWHEQNKSIKQDCQKSVNCWLPRGHQGKCQPEL
jgi:hypothetical protein